jgi:pyruvate dehydrogenase E1 component alpha subunit
VAFTGDGASNQGTVFEALNMAVVLKVPAIFIFENNSYGEHTHVSYACGASSIAERVHGFGLPCEVVDGMDFFAVHEAMARALEVGRNGGGPYALELRCKRFLGHFVGDPQAYRTPAELAEARAADPLPRFRLGVTEAGLLTSAELAEIETEILALIEQSVEAALGADFPDPARDLIRDVYVQYV